MFINLTNHPSSGWDSNQICDAQRYGDIVDLPFPQIGVDITTSHMDELVDIYYERIMGYDCPVVLLQGEFVFVFRLVTKLKAVGIRVVSTCVERCAKEENMPDGSVRKISMFVYRGLRDY